MSTTRLLFNWLAAEMKKYAGYRPVCHHPHFSVHAWPSRLNWQWRHVVTPPPKLFAQVFHHSQFVGGLARQACPALSCQSKGNSYNCICLYWQHCIDVIEDLHENNGISKEKFSLSSRISGWICGKCQSWIIREMLKSPLTPSSSPCSLLGGSVSEYSKLVAPNQSLDTSFRMKGKEEGGCW